MLTARILTCEYEPAEIPEIDSGLVVTAGLKVTHVDPLLSEYS